jgi:hypothetical protein
MKEDTTYRTKAGTENRLGANLRHILCGNDDGIEMGALLNSVELEGPIKAGNGLGRGTNFSFD